MGRRSSFIKIPRSLYQTWDPRATPPLMPHLRRRTRFVETCAGAAALTKQLVNHGHVPVVQYDLVPLKRGIKRKDALKLTKADLLGCRTIITNPPWDRPLLHAMIWHFLSLNVTVWLLFDAAWMNTKQSIPFKPYLRKIVSVGRLRWIPGTSMDGKDDCCWFCFSNKNYGETTQFYGRIET